MVKKKASSPDAQSLFRMTEKDSDENPGKNLKEIQDGDGGSAD